MSEFSDKMKKMNSKIDTCVRLGEKAEKLYDLTRGKKGLNKMLNGFASWASEIACNQGMKYVRRQTDLVAEEIKKMKKAQ